ncbi:MAG: UDP-4-amino-4,6-dideoxy-N-acetyl-beta-L-altrosamine transaminase [Flavobacterium sp.]|jgi:UDP-4-amino-4,6-dideoxy-N-acetyl-beta-L-altrosamine transaminase
MSIIPYGRQDISQDDIDAVVDILRSEFLTQGPAVERFERVIADYCGVSHVTAVNSATSALHIACLALGIGPKDTVWTSPITFVASANCALYCGAKIDFVDIDFATNNMSIVALKVKLEDARKTDTLPAVLIPVHMGGLSCDMQAIFKLSLEYGFKIIEDASHAIGGHYAESLIGCCKYSDITVFSFHPVKIITTGEGGAAVTNDSHLYKKLNRLRSHGITRDENEMIGSSDGVWYYQQVELGFNYRMTDMQAALGASQMSRIDQFVEKRNELAEVYREKLSLLPLDIPLNYEDKHSSYHLYIIKLHPDSKLSRREMFDHLRSNNIGVNVHYIPVHLQPYYQNLGFNYADFPESEKYYERALSIPLHPNLSVGDQNHVIAKIAEVL